MRYSCYDPFVSGGEARVYGGAAIVGPRGPRGLPGATGPMGPAGPAGPAGAVTPAAPVRDARGSTDVAKQFNLLLRNLREAGLLSAGEAGEDGGD